MEEKQITIEGFLRYFAILHSVYIVYVFIKTELKH